MDLCKDGEMASIKKGLVMMDDLGVAGSVSRWDTGKDEDASFSVPSLELTRSGDSAH